VATFATDTTWNVSGWQGTTVNGGSNYSGAAVVIDPQHTAWIDANLFSYGAKWIGVQVGNATYGYADPSHGSGVYVYTKSLELVPPPIPSSSVDLDFSFSADNWLDGLTISSGGHTFTVDSATLIALQGGPPNNNVDIGGGKQVYAFEYKWNLENYGTFTSPVTITATVQNWSYSQSPDPHNPVGFIASGELSYSAVPLPASVGVGFGMLGGFGALFGVRNKLTRRQRIA